MTPAARKLRVVLVRGPIVSALGSFNNEATPSLAFAYLAGYLRGRGYEPSMVDAIAEGLDRIEPLASQPGFQAHGLPLKEVVARIPEDAEVLAFSGMFSGEWPVLRELVALARRRFPKALFVAGGEHVTALPEYSLRDCPQLDACVRGEGERTLHELLEAYAATGSCRGVAGVSYLDKGGAYRAEGGLPRISQASAIDWPHWPEGYLERFWAAGKSYGVSTARDMPFMASRGCPYTCTFCSSPGMWTTRYVLRDPDDCFAEIESYLKRYGITGLQFYDLTAILKKDWIVAFARGLIARGIPLSWSLPTGTRSEALDAEVLTLLKQSGCSYLVYAPESGSQATLDRVRKRVRLPRLEQSVGEAIDRRIGVRTNLIIGFPGEDRRGVLATLLFGLKMAWRGADDVGLFLFSPYPGSEIFEDLRREGRLRLDDAYFLELAAVNGSFARFAPRSYNERMGPRELGCYRLAFLVLCYAAGYLRHPSRFARTLRNLFTERSSSVLEHRLKDVLRRRGLLEAPSLPV